MRLTLDRYDDSTGYIDLKEGEALGEDKRERALEWARSNALQRLEVYDDTCKLDDPPLLVIPVGSP